MLTNEEVNAIKERANNYQDINEFHKVRIYQIDNEVANQLFTAQEDVKKLLMVVDQLQNSKENLEGTVKFFRGLIKAKGKLDKKKTTNIDIRFPVSKDNEKALEILDKQEYASCKKPSMTTIEIDKTPRSK